MTFAGPGTRYRLINQTSGAVLDAVTCGTALIQWASLGNARRQWSVTPVIADRGNGKVLDVADCATVRQWAAPGDTCREWRITL